jgi:hypothetical protein
LSRNNLATKVHEPFALRYRRVNGLPGDLEEECRMITGFMRGLRSK